MFNVTLHNTTRKITRRLLSTILLVGACALPTDAAVIPYDQVVNSMNPIAYWRQEGNGNDSTSNGHNGAINGTSTFVAGPSLPGITGNQAGSYGGGGIIDINVPDADAFSFGDSSTDSPFSLSVWIQPNTPIGAFNGILGKDISGANREWALLLNNDRTLRMFIKNQGGGNQKSVDTTFMAPTDSWTNVVVTYDGSSTVAGLNFWINGSPTATTVSADATYTAMANTAADVTLGSYFGGANFFEGLIDEAAIFNGVLTANQISLLSGQPLLVPEPSSFLLLGLGALGLVRHRRRKTAAVRGRGPGMS